MTSKQGKLNALAAVRLMQADEDDDDGTEPTPEVDIAQFLTCNSKTDELSSSLKSILKKPDSVCSLSSPTHGTKDFEEVQGKQLDADGVLPTDSIDAPINQESKPAGSDVTNTLGVNDEIVTTTGSHVTSTPGGSDCDVTPSESDVTVTPGVNDVAFSAGEGEEAEVGAPPAEESSSPKTTEPDYNHSRRVVVLVTGLPFEFKMSELFLFFGIWPLGGENGVKFICDSVGDPTGRAYVELERHSDKMVLLRMSGMRFKKKTIQISLSSGNAMEIEWTTTMRIKKQIEQSPFVLIGNLQYTMTREEIFELLSGYNRKPEDVYHHSNKETHFNSGYCYVIMDDKHEAEKICLSALSWKQRPLTTRKVHPELFLRWCRRNHMKPTIRPAVAYDMSVDLPEPRLDPNEVGDARETEGIASSTKVTSPPPSGSHLNPDDINKDPHSTVFIYDEDCVGAAIPGETSDDVVLMNDKADSSVLVYSSRAEEEIEASKENHPGAQHKRLNEESKKRISFEDQHHGPYQAPRLPPKNLGPPGPSLPLMHERGLPPRPPMPHRPLMPCGPPMLHRSSGPPRPPMPHGPHFPLGYGGPPRGPRPHNKVGFPIGPNQMGHDRMIFRPEFGFRSSPRPVGPPRMEGPVMTPSGFPPSIFVRMYEVPERTTTEDIRDFFNPIIPAKVAQNVGYNIYDIDFYNPGDAMAALQRNGLMIRKNSVKLEMLPGPPIPLPPRKLKKKKKRPHSPSFHDMSPPPPPHSSQPPPMPKPSQDLALAQFSNMGESIKVPPFPDDPFQYHIRPFDPDTPEGQCAIQPMQGYFCKLCRKFYKHRQAAYATHCKTKGHYDNLKQHLEESRSRGGRQLLVEAS